MSSNLLRAYKELIVFVNDCMLEQAFHSYPLPTSRDVVVRTENVPRAHNL